MRKRLFPISWVMLARMADISTIVEEDVTGIRVVKSFAAEEAQIGLFDRAARRLRWVSIEQVNNQAKFAPLMQIIPQMSLAVILLFGGYQVIHGNLSYGTFSAFNIYVVMLQMPFVMVGMLMMIAQRAAASAQRVFEVLDAEPDMVDTPGAVDLLDCEGDVEFRHVEFAYGENPPLFRDLDLHLRPGETVALVGRTGSGKSSVARLVPRFYDVTGGAILIDGTDIRDLTLASLRATIGTVTDEPFLFSESVGANIAFARPSAPMAEIEAAARAAGAHDFIMELSDGYETVIGERGYTLSGGQRQRIAIARTLLDNPRVLILDDATSAIDAQREFEIHGALRTLMQGRTTLIIAHRLSTISLAERVVVLEDGHIVADGSHATLMRDVPLYREILAHGEAEYEREHAAKTDEEIEAARLARIRELTEQALGAKDNPGDRRTTWACPDVRRRLMWGGGGGGGGMWGGGGGGAGGQHWSGTGGGAKFMGIPPELEDKVRFLVDKEPDFDLEHVRVHAGLRRQPEAVHAAPVPRAEEVADLRCAGAHRDGGVLPAVWAPAGGERGQRGNRARCLRRQG